MKRNLKENADILGISKSYLSQIINGKRGCDEKLMLNIKTLYPELNFTLLNPRYILRKDDDKCNYMEYRELARKYNIGASSIDWRNSTYNELDNLLNIIMDCKKG